MRSPHGRHRLANHRFTLRQVDDDTSFPDSGTQPGDCGRANRGSRAWARRDPLDHRLRSHWRATRWNAGSSIAALARVNEATRSGHTTNKFGKRVWKPKTQAEELQPATASVAPAHRVTIRYL